ncbi:MAG: cyclodeaminase/cyclohydrolase family protein [Chloroflexi bacterium]|nr:MAG: cyclodeaminase/cyclohydrolase family protein [Chloroflexota bacterium]
MSRRHTMRHFRLTETEAQATAALSQLSVDELLERLSSSAPVPGGGSAAALAGAMGASLVSMVAALTVGREAYVQVDVTAREIGQSANSLRQELVDLAEQDSAAYRAFVSARGLPRETDAQRAARASAMQDASKRSTEAPLRTARVAREALELARRIAPIGNRNAVSDAGVAAQLLSAAVRGASLNVRINLPLLAEDEPLRLSAPADLADLERETADLEAAALADVSSRIA